MTTDTPPPIDLIVPPRLGPSTEAPPEKPWGFWATIGMSLIVFASVMSGQAFVTFVYGVYSISIGTFGESLSFDERQAALVEHVQWNGALTSITIFATTFIGVAWILLFVVLRKGCSPGNYLALKPVRVRALLVWMAGAIVLGWVVDWVVTWIDGQTVPDYMIRLYETAGFLPLLWIAMILVSPVFEETFYRGFIYAGVERSRIGAPGAILVATLVNCLLLYQYDWIIIASYVPLGLFIGFARFKTGSLLPCLAMRAALNGASMVTLALYVT